MITGVQELFNFDEKSQGIAILQKFEITEFNAKLHNFSQIRDFGWKSGTMMCIYPGKYVKLEVNGELMMSDTHMERKSNFDFIDNAKGDVMIAGLGIGLILHNIRNKVNSGEIKSITIYEKYQDVIDLVSPYYNDMPITYKCQDILEYIPPKEEKYDTLYFDIWPTIDYEKNLPEIRLLHNRWKYHKKDKNSWMNSWMKEFMQYRKKVEY